MNQASENELGALHAALAATLNDLLKGRIVLTKDGPLLDGDGEPVREPPGASDLSVIVKFLKDNNITASVANNDALSELEKKMAARRQGRLTPVTGAELRDAMNNTLQ